MKKVTLRKVQRPDGDKNVFDYQEQMAGLVSAPDDPTKGMDFEEMEKIRPVYTKLKAAHVPEIGDATVLLEDAEFEVLIAKMKQGKFIGFIPEMDDMITLTIKSPDHLVDVPAQAQDKKDG